MLFSPVDYIDVGLYGEFWAGLISPTWLVQLFATLIKSDGLLLEVHQWIRQIFADAHNKQWAIKVAISTADGDAFATWIISQYLKSHPESRLRWSMDSSRRALVELKPITPEYRKILEESGDTLIQRMIAEQRATGTISPATPAEQRIWEDYWLYVGKIE